MADRGRIAGAGGLLVLSLAAGQVLGQEERPPASPAAEALPTRIPAGSVEHGRYLVHDVAQCVECHSPRDANGVILRGQEFTGAPIPFRPPWANEWAIQAPRNRGLPGYTTELGIRLLTQGAIDREGRQLRPPMPRFRMSPQDAADVVAYLKSLQ
jgi:mono/diheme cytochrome c family protein